VPPSSNAIDPPPHHIKPLDLANAIALRDAAIGQIEFARRYTLELLDATPQDRWFESPSSLPTHIAWQVGHLAVSQYGLLMFRQRGRAPGDLDLVPGTFRKRFGRSSQPFAPTDATDDDNPAALLQRLQTIHTQAIAELTTNDPAQLLEPTEMPYAVYPQKIGCILFAPLHEQIHSGQIGLIRRLLGLPSIR
jgi:hypothetical protein